MKNIIKKLPIQRKLWICILFFITSIIFVFTKNVDFTQWSTFIQYTFAIYVGSNAIEKINRKKQLSNWKSKKLWIFIGIYIVSIVMVIYKFANFQNWSEFVNWLYGFYSASNISSDFISLKNNKTIGVDKLND